MVAGVGFEPTGLAPHSMISASSDAPSARFARGQKGPHAQEPKGSDRSRGSNDGSQTVFAGPFFMPASMEPPSPSPDERPGTT